MNGDELQSSALEFGEELDRIKAEIAPDFLWYPYGTQNNFIHLKDLFNQYPLDQLTSKRHIGDIGAADGDLAFFMQSLGYSVDIIDYAPTNYNSIRGVRALVDRLKVSDSVKVHELDIDSQFTLPNEGYDLVFLLGILYHLKNPYYVLERLSKAATHVMLSTRVARYLPDGRSIMGSPVAYLLDPQESNNDATNYWIFSEAGLNRLVQRAGWNILASKAVGDTITSNPSDAHRDERCFMLLKSKRV